MPDEDWRSPDFDDSEWTRQRVPVEKANQSANRQLTALHSATDSAVICARAKFLVDDPAKLGDLRLSLKYVGGVAVFVNGKEVARQHLPNGDLEPAAPAEKYPDDLYVTADGKSMQHVSEHWKAYQRDEERFNRRYRGLEDVVIPASMLQKGLNVLAIQLHRAPVNEAATTVERTSYGGMGRTYGLWAYVGLRDLELISASGEGVRPNLGRHAPGAQVWNCAPFATLTLDSFGDPGSSPAPVEIDAVLGGAFSGRLVVSSDEAIEDLDVTVSKLTAEGGKALPAGAVEVRHGVPAHPSTSPRPQPLFDGLHAGVPSRVEYVSVELRDHARRVDYTVGGAIAPVWITVQPPKDAAPGLYTGTVTVQASGLEKTVVPLRCRVHGWTLPDPGDYRVKTLNVQSPYSLAAHYKVPLWSEEHFELIERAFRLVAGISGRRVDVDLVPGLRYGTAPVGHSMFRLVPKKGGNGYDYDFSVIERLFDLVERTMKEPLPLQVNCWGYDHTKNADSSAGWLDPVKQVPVLDPETGELSHVDNPPPGTEAHYTFWKPILDELRQRIEKRGWFEATAIGHQNVWNSCSRNWHQDRSPLSVLLRKPEEMIMRGHDGLGYLCVDLLPIEAPEKRKGHEYYQLRPGVGGIVGYSTTSILAALLETAGLEEAATESQVQQAYRLEVKPHGVGARVRIQAAGDLGLYYGGPDAPAEHRRASDRAGGPGYRLARGGQEAGQAAGGVGTGAAA